MAANSKTNGAPYSKYIKLSNYFGTQSTSNTAYSSVVFFITPEMSESRSVSYIEIGDIRMPASLLIYMGSPSRSFTINAKFLARSQAEADVSFRNKSVLESWCVTNPTLGNALNAVTQVNNQITPQDQQSPGDTASTATQAGNGPLPYLSVPAKSTATTQPFTQTTNLFAQSPPVLSLEGYGGQFRRIPVVIRSLNISYPTDVDYVASSNNTLVPILQDISITLSEARNIDAGYGAMNSFNLSAFKQGTLQFW